MSHDEFVARLSGADGVLATVAESCAELNASMTSFGESLFGSADGVDTFDASCNTCKHFERLPMSAGEKRLRNVFGMPGRCALKQVDVRGWQRGQFCQDENGECYQNRRTGLRPSELKVI